MQSLLQSLVFFFLALGLVGCGASTGESIETIHDSPSSVGADTDIGTEAAALLGSYEASDGTLLGLVLAKKDGNRVFVADQQVMCFKAPCMPEHLSGTWTALDGVLKLTENANKHVYEYALESGKLTLKDPASHKAVGVMGKVATWCGESAQCELQQVSQPQSNEGATKVVCRADQTCGVTTGDAVGYGDACGQGVGCIDGLRCQSGVCAP